MDAKFSFTNQTITNLKEEAAKLKTIIAAVEQDRNEMHVSMAANFFLAEQ